MNGPTYRCPICGRKATARGHQCPQSVLSAIDAADKRASLDDLDPTRGPNEFWRSEGRRIAEGNDLLDMGGDR